LRTLRLPPEQPKELGLALINDLADPSALLTGKNVFIFGTTNFLRVPAYDLSKLSGSPQLFPEGVVDAMPGDAPAWVDTARQGIWAPTVAKFGDQFVMFFAANRSNPADPANRQCIGRATSTQPAGPFLPSPDPATCGVDPRFGALDPSIFRDRNGQSVLLFASGGADNIWSQPLTADGSLQGSPTLLLRRDQPWQDWILENPSMTGAGNELLLSFSTGKWQTTSYRTGVSVCSTPAGPCAVPVPWLSNTDGTHQGPGGLEFFGGDGASRWAVFHTYEGGRTGDTGARHTHLVKVTS
jgi:hypothetical protein